MCKDEFLKKKHKTAHRILQNKFSRSLNKFENTLNSHFTQYW